MTFLIEGLGALGIYVLWGDYQFASPGEKIYTSIFHSVSAFCNAGFSTFEYNFETPLISELYMLHIFVGVIKVSSIIFYLFPTYLSLSGESKKLNLSFHFVFHLTQFSFRLRSSLLHYALIETRQVRLETAHRFRHVDHVAVLEILLDRIKSR